MPRKHSETTSTRVARIASKLLKSSRSSRKVKSVSGSALTQKVKRKK